MTADSKTSPATRTGRANRGSKPGERRGAAKNPKAGPGRPKGCVNKVTREFRETVQKLLDDNRDNVAKWLKQVAEGSPEVLDKAGKVVINARPPNPDAALQRLGHLAEFAAPKLSRAEVVGDGGGPLTVVINKLG